MSRLGDLAPETRFRLPESGRTGTVLEQGVSGTTVRYEGSRRKVKGRSTKTDQTFEFEASGPAMYISSETEVVLLGDS